MLSGVAESIDHRNHVPQYLFEIAGKAEKSESRISPHACPIG
jgi:hypothetical protein